MLADLRYIAACIVVLSTKVHRKFIQGENFAGFKKWFSVGIKF